MQERSRSAPLAAGGAVLHPADSALALQEAIPHDAILLEYFECRGRLYLFLIRREGLALHRLGPMNSLSLAVKLLQFQLGKYRVQPNSKGDAARHHLAALGEGLLGPAGDELKCYGRWIVAPHRQLHGVPFAALESGGACVLDRAEILYTPSASVFAACRRRPPSTDGAPSFVMAAPDARGPNIEKEAAQVAALIPGARLVTGEEATIEAFRGAAANCSILHLAAHGVFRKDNPMFSSIQLADGRLSLFDLAGADWNAGLVVLSACNTGSAVSVGGGELLGLMRGFLAAGARNLLVSLWEVDDSGTADFMADYYRQLASGSEPAAALRHASGNMRRLRPHPYYWAPFILVGA